MAIGARPGSTRLGVAVAARRERQRSLVTMRFLHLIRPVMCVLPEVAQPDRKVSSIVGRDFEVYSDMSHKRHTYQKSL